MKKVTKDIMGWTMVVAVGVMWLFVYNNYFKKEVVFEKLLEKRLANSHCFEIPHDYVYDVENLYIDTTRTLNKKSKAYECYFDLIRAKGRHHDTLKYMAIIYDAPNDKYEVFGLAER